MKKFKVRYVIIALLVLLIGVGAVLGVSFFRSPEYALIKISNDVKESGVEGLMPHLTEDAQKTVGSIAAIAENDTVNSILSLFGKEDGTSIFTSNLKEIEWSLKDILRGGDSADVRVGFNYKDKVTGTIDINMVREDGDWKISGVGNPKFDDVNLGN